MKKRIKPEKIALDEIKRETVLEFLSWLEQARSCSVSTRNTRLAAIHSFCRYTQYEDPGYLFESQRVLSIPHKRSSGSIFKYLTVEGVKLLLSQPNLSSKRGRRDLALLSLIYDSGGRVQEIIDLTPTMVRLSPTPVLNIIGKGQKTRVVPMLNAQLDILERYMKENGLLAPEMGSHPLFFNARREKLSRVGVNYILRKYASRARNENSSLIPQKISCHSLRHSKAMHLLQAGVNLIYIRDILGHSSVKTTEIYARADSSAKRRALEEVYTNLKPSEESLWEGNHDLVSWLRSF